MTERKDDIGLDAFFAAAQDDTPLPSGDFLARIEADALAALPDPVPVTAAARVVPLWRQMLQAVGGWPGAAGLASACAVGVWIGVSPPDGISDIWTQTVGLGELGVDPLSGYDLAMMEG